MTIRVLVLICLASMALALQQAPIPTFPGDDNRAHDGQPLWCQNHDGGGHAHNCECHSMKPTESECERQGHQHDDEEDAPAIGNDSSRCKTYCRKTACRCRNNCGG